MSLGEVESLIADLRTRAQLLRAQAADLADAETADYSDGLTKITCDSAGQIIEIGFTSELAFSSPARLARSVMNVYQVAAASARERMARLGDAANGRDFAAPPDIGESQLAVPLTRVADEAFGRQLDGAFEVARTRGIEAALNQLGMRPSGMMDDPHGFQDRIRSQFERRVTRSIEQAELVAAIDGRAETAFVEVLVGVWGDLRQVSFRPRALACEPSELALAVLAAVGSAQIDARRQADALPGSADPARPDGGVVR